MSDKLSKSEALRRTIEHSREEVITLLATDSDKDLYQKVVDGDLESIKKAQKHSLGTPIYEASGYIFSDFLDITQELKKIANSDEDLSNAFTQPTSTPAPSPMGIPNIPGLFPGLNPSSTPVSTNPVPLDLSLLNELLDAWKDRYGDFKGYYQEQIIKNSLDLGIKEVLKELMDRDIFNKDSIYRIKKQTSKNAAFIKNKEYEYLDVPFFQFLMKSNNTSLYELLVEHSSGKDMWANTLNDLKYEVLQFCFDTENKDLFESLIAQTPTLEGMVSSSGSPMICDYMYRCNDSESDISNLELIVNKGASLTALDPLRSNALMVATRVGNLSGVNFALKYNVFDLQAKNLSGETVLSLAQEGPAKRKNEQEAYDEAVEEAKIKFKDKHDAWIIKAQSMEAAGKKPPPEPQEPQFKPRPEDYPIAIIELIEQAWMMSTANPPAIEDNKPSDDDLGLGSFEFEGSF